VPVEVKGLRETRRALAKFAPDLKRELDKDARNRLKALVTTARGFAPTTLPDNLHGWAVATKGRKITAQTSAFSTRTFPLYQAGEVKSGISYDTGFSKTNSRGFRTLYELRNKSAAGAIYETAGRINPGVTGNKGLPWEGPKASPGNRKVSHSRNPNAGAWFIDEIDKQDNQREIRGKKEGRLIFRAVENDNGRFIKSIIAGMKRVEYITQGRLDSIKAFGGNI
jgi:hypothetical protein